MSYSYRVLLYQVIDGDSVRVSLDLGFGMEYNCIARMMGIDAPEKATTAGRLVKQVVTRWLEARTGVLEFTSTEKPKYSRRAIGHLYSRLNRDETLSRFLLAAGMAKEYAGGQREWSNTERQLVEQKCRETLAGM